MVDFMAGAHVFPGGRLDPADTAGAACAAFAATSPSPQERLGEPIPALHAAGLFIAAVRETCEEAGLQLEVAALVPWVRWVTPEVSPRRFDARFFLARAPLGQEPRVDGHEATEGLWITPQGAMQRWQEGGMQLAPATAKSMDMLLAYATVDEALAAAARRPPPVAKPVVWNDRENGRAYISLPGDPRHPLPDVLGGTIRRFHLEEGRYRAVRAA
jgi:8-oxo-dGTP pyrophosphatase MutT (NUDIX family)